MPGYLVRHASDHELVGIFVADDLNNLRFHIDECTDPDLCEYTVLPTGGLLWEGRAQTVPLPRTVPEEIKAEGPLSPEDEKLFAVPEDLDWSECDISEYWYEAFYGKAAWKRLPPLPGAN